MQRMITKCLLAVGIVGLAAGCAAPSWRSVDEDKIWSTCVGEVVSIQDVAAGHFTIRIRPRAADASLLAPGQKILDATIPASGRKELGPLLKKVRKGMQLEATGYWVKKTSNGSVRHHLRDTTSIRILKE